LSREIEKYAGCNISEIHSLYGTNAYRRYEKRVLEEIVRAYKEVMIATPAGLVSEASTLNETLCASVEALENLKGILDGRTAFTLRLTWCLTLAFSL